MKIMGRSPFIMGPYLATSMHMSLMIIIVLSHISPCLFAAAQQPWLEIRG